jgi:hypothetical protein
MTSDAVASSDGAAAEALVSSDGDVPFSSSLLGSEAASSLGSISAASRITGSAGARSRLIQIRTDAEAGTGSRSASSGSGDEAPGSLL